jgi:hypothetical protein
MSTTTTFTLTEEEERRRCLTRLKHRRRRYEAALRQLDLRMARRKIAPCLKHFIRQVEDAYVVYLQSVGMLPGNRDHLQQLICYLADRHGYCLHTVAQHYPSMTQQTVQDRLSAAHAALLDDPEFRHLEAAVRPTVEMRLRSISPISSPLQSATNE